MNEIAKVASWLRYRAECIAYDFSYLPAEEWGRLWWCDYHSKRRDVLTHRGCFQ